MKDKWQNKSKELIIDATKIVLLLEKLAQEELEHRKAAGDAWQIEDNSDVALSGAKLTIAKLEYTIKSDKADHTILHQRDLISCLNQLRENLRKETMHATDLEFNKNFVLRHISKLNVEMRKHNMALVSVI